MFSGGTHNMFPVEELPSVQLTIGPIGKITREWHLLGTLQACLSSSVCDLGIHGE